MIRAAILVALAACSAPAKPPACVDPNCPKTQHTRVAPFEGTGTLAGESIPRFFPNFTKPCKEASTFGDLMKNHLNTSLTRISSALFHPQGNKEQRLDEIADASAEILGCAQRIEDLRPAIDASHIVVFDHFMIQLVMNVHALQTAALEDELDIVTHWYHHVKQSCAACHARFNDK